MSKKVINSQDCNQLSFFADNNSIQASTDPRQYLQLEKLELEDRRIRASFTSKEDYYQSPQWQSKRLQKLRQVGNKCEECGRAGSLDVHHLNYDSLYDERMEDLQAVCRSCHDIADDAREDQSAYSSYLDTKFGEGESWKFDSEYEYERFREWRESKQDEW